MNIPASAYRVAEVRVQGSDVHAFVALTCMPGESAYRAVPILAADLDEAKTVAGHLAGEVHAVLTPDTVAALGAALAKAQATIELRGSMAL